MHSSELYSVHFLYYQGDGTTSSVLLTGELLKQAERYLSEVRIKSLSHTLRIYTRMRNDA